MSCTHPIPSWLTSVAAAAIMIGAGALGTPAKATVLQGPAPSKFTTYNTNPAKGGGIEFQALKSTFISNFVVVASGQARINGESVFLYNATGALLHSIVIPGSNFALTGQNYAASIDVNWSVDAGSIYWLVDGGFPTNAFYNRWVSSGSANSIPYASASNADLLMLHSGGTFGITGTTPSFGSDNTAGVWMNFSSVTTANPTVPEPASLALLGAGLAGLAGARRRRA